MQRAAADQDASRPQAGRTGRRPAAGLGAAPAARAARDDGRRRCPTRASAASPPQQRAARLRERQRRMREAMCQFVSELITADIVGKEIALSTRTRFGRRTGSLREHVQAMLREVGVVRPSARRAVGARRSASPERVRAPPATRPRCSLDASLSYVNGAPATTGRRRHVRGRAHGEVRRALLEERRRRPRAASALRPVQWMHCESTRCASIGWSAPSMRHIMRAGQRDRHRRGVVGDLARQRVGGRQQLVGRRRRG